jgi:DNA polymerase III alpha subunit
MSLPDIDLDFADREKILKILRHHPAGMIKDGQLVKHNTGAYVQDIPVDPVTKIASIDYKEAEDRGYFKLDFLNVAIYENIKDEAHLTELMMQEPDWNKLQDEAFVKQLFHIGEYADLCKKLKPQSVEQLAAVLAIIRPSKRYLKDSSWVTIMKEVWVRPTDDQYFFKKSHATAYAHAIVVQMNLLS